MKKAIFVGDCHLARVYEYHDETNCPIDIKFWGLAGLKVFNLDFFELEKNKKVSSGTEIGNKDAIIFEPIEDETLVILWIGYVDIRQYLPKYNNAKELVKNYVDNAIKYFKNCKILFIEPLPQFDKMYLKYEGISPSYTYEERETQNKLFNKYLDEYLNELGLTKSVKQEKLFNVLGVKQLDENVLRKIAPHPVDSLSEEYNKKLYDFFTDLAIKNL
jgi:hypothetical protein